MRVALDVRKHQEPGTTGWSVTVTYNGVTRPRQLLEDDDRQPLPPLEEAAEWQTLPCGDPNAPKPLALYKQVVGEMIDTDTVSRYGSYLCAVLLGPVWLEIEAAAPPGEVIELGIRIAPDDRVMHRLHWEMILGDYAAGSASSGCPTAAPRRDHAGDRRRRHAQVDQPAATYAVRIRRSDR